MSTIINPIDIGNVKNFVYYNQDKMEHVCSGQYHHFYIIRARGFVMCVKRSMYAGYEHIIPMSWMTEDHEEELRSSLIKSAEMDV